MVRVYGILGPTDTVDLEYIEGLRSAVSAAVDYGLVAIKRGEDRSVPIPPILIAQARLAARNGVSLDTILRRYVAGQALLADFLIEEAEPGKLLQSVTLKRLLRAQATIFDRLLAEISVEYTREAEGFSGSTEQRRSARIDRLLSGESLDTSGLAYAFDAHHLGMIVVGPNAADVIKGIASRLDCRLLFNRRTGGVAWAWLGSRRRIESAELERMALECRAQCLTLAVGEPGRRLAGWRLSHQQARAALPLAQRKQQAVIRYADVLLLASMRRDDLLVRSMNVLFVDPLARERDGGTALRETLLSYFKAGRNASSAAAALGVTRQTVNNRLRTVEKRIGRSLDSCAIELEAALQLTELGDSGALSERPRANT